MGLIALDLNPTPKQVRIFGSVGIPLTLGILGLAGGTHFESSSNALFLGVLAVGAIGSSWLYPPVIRILLLGFRLSTYPIALVFAHITLAAFFFLVLPPLGLLVRWLHGDPLSRRWDPSSSSYWTACTSSAPRRYLRPY